MHTPKLHVDAAGDGPVVVLGHGLGGSARNWRGQQRALRDAFRVVAFDARGHARSEAPVGEGAYGADALAADLGRVLDEQASGPAVVGGLSLGAGIALRFALAQPERVRALVLCAYPSSSGFGAVAHPFADAIEREGLDAAGERYVWGPDSGLDEEAARFVRMGFLEHAPHGIAGILRETLPALPNPARDRAALAVPTLVVCGDRDTGSLAVCRELAATLPNARLEIVAEAGHVVNLAQPKAVNALFREFLAGL